MLQDGAAWVCTLSFECIQLTQPGDTAIITSTGGKIGDQQDQQPALDVCRNLQRANAGLCQQDAIRGRSRPHHHDRRR